MAKSKQQIINEQHDEILRLKKVVLHMQQKKLVQQEEPDDGHVSLGEEQAMRHAF